VNFNPETQNLKLNYYWWFPTDGLYDASTGGNNFIGGTNSIKDETVYAQPLQTTRYYAIGIDKTWGCYNNADNSQTITFKTIGQNDGRYKVLLFRKPSGGSAYTVTDGRVCANAGDDMILKLWDTNSSQNKLFAYTGATR